MSWKSTKLDRLTVDEALDILKRHRLLLGEAVCAAGQCATIAQSDAWEIRDGDELVARVFTRGGVDPWVAGIDVIPVPRFFRVREEYSDHTANAFRAIIDDLRQRGVGRISAQIPASRSRTMKCLKAAGFRYEGRMYGAIMLGRARGREDLYMYALMTGADQEDQHGDR